MSTHPALLLEIGCEELPSSNLRELGEALHAGVREKLAAHKLEHGTTHWFATPRRLAVLIEDLVQQAPDETREALGPPLAQARDENGNWTKAASGFAARQGLTPDDLEVMDTPKGQRLGLRQTVAGVRTREILAAIAQQAAQELPISKRMRWGATRMEFARPVHWVVLMYGGESGFGTVMGCESGNSTHGHRFHAPQSIDLGDALDYEKRLAEAHVVADFEQRCTLIREQVTALATQLSAVAVIDDALLDEVSSLVEWPVALAGTFDEEFLEVPAEALISSMQSHQKYFPLRNTDGSLAPRFITISNIESRDPQQVIAGNEKVIRPRLADAAFFFEQDKQHRLDSRLERLDDVVFQEKLGSIGDKSRRIARLAGALAPAVGADTTLAMRAAELCKADLVSDMVLEFGELQGIAGGYYARNDGEDPVVARAITEHYWPKQAGSELPTQAEGVAVALADRLDTLLGIFAIGQPPSGSRDPFALRRASIGCLRIMIEKALDLDLRDCLELAAQGFEAGLAGPESVQAVLDYILDRLPALYESGDMSVETLRAVRAIGCSVPSDFDRRARAVRAFFALPEAAALAAANKRVSNILSKAGIAETTTEVNADLLHKTEEKALYAALQSAEADTAASLAKADYAGALARLAGLREPVDAFFDGVMVNADDPALKRNRLSLLAQLRGQFLSIADISQLAG